MRAHRVGEHAVLVECAGTDEVQDTYALLAARREELGAVEVVPAARTVLLDGLADPGLVAARLAAWTAPPAPAAVSARVEVPVRYDGADLEEVAGQWQVGVEEVVAIHTGTEFTVAFCGFAPGFAYCTGLPVDRAVRRRASPRTAVPAGSVALAGEYTGVYPTSSPGGWQLLGRTELELWRADAEQPALLVPGTRVRFRAL
ncbi:MAG: allophanate hydrolase subunit 1 [Nocardioidaceae bacterium]|nr:allophanate hydrolase subunit 1 [Nocardioidaceae bacterium]